MVLRALLSQKESVSTLFISDSLCILVENNQYVEQTEQSILNDIPPFHSPHDELLAPFALWQAPSFSNCALLVGSTWKCVE